MSTNLVYIEPSCLNGSCHAESYVIVQGAFHYDISTSKSVTIRENTHNTNINPNRTERYYYLLVLLSSANALL